MAIVNRDLDPSQQTYTVGGNNLGVVATGATIWVGVVPVAGQLSEVKLFARGLSGLPTYQLAIQRATAGGITGIPLGSAIALTAAFGVTNAVGATFAPNSSLAAVVPGDMIIVNSGVANTAVTDLVVDVVIRATQDIKKTFDI